MAVDFDFFLRQKYSQLQQQADATTRNAATNALVGKAAAGLDSTRAALMPAESRANIGQTLANTNLLGEQAAIVRPESAARIRGMDADTKRTLTGEEIDRRQGLMSIGDIIGGDTLTALRSSLLGGTSVGGGTFRTSNITPAFPDRRAAIGTGPRGSGPNGAMTAAELDRYNGL